MLNPGTTIQNYKVLSLIGKGGMGAVYKCEDKMLGRIVAIKELNTLLTTDPNFVQRFRQEAQLQAKLIHPHIVSLHTFFEEFGQYYMVMEYAEGKTVKDLVRQIGPVPEQRALHILKQVLQALTYAHSKNIIHRDIKPVNIILDSKDEIKILDFGIARIMGEQGLTQTGQQLGTVTYMSPEQVKALKDIDARSDIYSLGVTLFEMLSGRLPYDTNTDSDYVIMNQIVQSPLPDPRQYYPHITEQTVLLLNKMLEKDRDKRYRTAEEVLHAIELGYTPLQQPEPVKPVSNTGAAMPTGYAAQGQSQDHNQVNSNIPTYLTQAILVTLFCCIPFGIPAIIAASKVSNLIYAQRYDEASVQSQQAKKWVNVAFWCGIGYLAVCAVVGFAEGLAGG